MWEAWVLKKPVSDWAQRWDQFANFLVALGVLLGINKSTRFQEAQPCG